MLVEIECPACKLGHISFEPHLLAQGASFSCNSCGAEVSVTQDSKDVLKNSVSKYDRYKEKLLTLQKDGNNPL
ncbi:hypothetical protein [Sulfurimonas sp. HSL3-2]|uniref:hypothetical protein n=1 Tax=Hydrocurvibacter mobilis TaxID=3131936 RepID=UPI0031F8908F